MRPEVNAARRRPLGLIALLAVLLALLTVPAGPLTGAHAAACGTANAAQGRTATASSTENGSFAAANAVDGDTGTRWSSTFSDPQWIQVDLGGSQTVCEVVLGWEAAYAKAYQIQLSANGSDWTTVASTSTGAGGTETRAVSGTGRYLRVYGTTRATGYGYSLWELAVHTTDGGTGPVIPGGGDLGPNVLVFDPRPRASRPGWTRSSSSRSPRSSAPDATRCCSSPAPTTTSTPTSASTPRSPGSDSPPTTPPSTAT